MKIYAASSWRNEHFNNVVSTLRVSGGHEVYDFRDEGFSWRELDGAYKAGEPWGAAKLNEACTSKVAQEAFARDMNALRRCDACVLVLPAGRSAHLEAGWAVGAGKRVVVYAPEPIEPELMYLITLGVRETMLGVLMTLEGR